MTSPYADRLAAIPTRERTSDVLGASTAWWEYGDPDAETTLVLVHGFRGDHHGLEPIVAHLGQGIRSIVPDLPGFGASDPLRHGAHDIAGYAAWLRAFVATVGGPDPVVLGHSFGSIVVASAAASGLRARRLVLVNPIAAPALEGPKAVLSRLAALYYRLGAVLPRPLGFALLRNRLVVRIMSIAMTTTRQPALRRWIHDQHDRYFSAFDDRRVVLEAFRASISEDVSHFVPRITERTLLIAAAEDQITPLPAQRTLAQRFTDGALVVVPSVGHLIHYEAPAAAAAAITAFLSPDRDPHRTWGAGDDAGAAR